MHTLVWYVHRRSPTKREHGESRVITHYQLSKIVRLLTRRNDLLLVEGPNMFGEYTYIYVCLQDSRHVMQQHSPQPLKSLAPPIKHSDTGLSFAGTIRLECPLIPSCHLPNTVNSTLSRLLLQGPILRLTGAREDIPPHRCTPIATAMFRMHAPFDNCWDTRSAWQMLPASMAVMAGLPRACLSLPELKVGWDDTLIS